MIKKNLNIKDALDLAGKFKTVDILECLITKANQEILIAEYLKKDSKKNKVLVYNLKLAIEEYDE